MTPQVAARSLAPPRLSRKYSARPGGALLTFAPADTGVLHAVDTAHQSKRPRMERDYQRTGVDRRGVSHSSARGTLSRARSTGRANSVGRARFSQGAA